jgi:hypothetical protein
MTSLILKFQKSNLVQTSECGTVAFLNILTVYSSNLVKQILPGEGNGEVVPLRNQLSTTQLRMVEWRYSYKYTTLDFGTSRGERSVSRPCRFTAGKRDTGTHSDFLNEGFNTCF